MPITKSAQKAMRAAAKKRVTNLRRDRAMGAAEREVEKLVAAGKAAEAKKLLPKVYAAIDKAAKRGVIKANTAARRKARVSRLAKDKRD
jgi:small subunit ribosomal protein S20